MQAILRWVQCIHSIPRLRRTTVSSAARLGIWLHILCYHLLTLQIKKNWVEAGTKFYGVTITPANKKCDCQKFWQGIYSVLIWTYSYMFSILAALACMPFPHPTRLMIALTIWWDIDNLVLQSLAMCFFNNKTFMVATHMFISVLDGVYT